MGGVRFEVRKGSQSGHCCFGYTVVDTGRPAMMHGAPYVPNGVPQYEAMCECLDSREAEQIAAALNDEGEVRYTLTEAGKAALGEG